MPADLRRARELFLHAVGKLPPEEWDGYVADACGGDAELRQQAAALLQVHREAGSFLNVPAVDQVAAGLRQSDAPVAIEPDTEGPATVPTGEDQPDQAVTRDEEQGDQEENGLAFLEPSARPGSLGRLGHYEVLEVLGRGGFGVVVKAFDEMLHRVVAVKVMASHLASTSPARKRFLREARAFAAVRHEHVVAIHAVEEQPVPYLVMDYIAGLTLQQKLDQTGPLGTSEVLRLGQQIASGLAAAHARGLIHRDVKPANILLESGVEPRVKLTDFGLARAADDASLTQSGFIAGTPMYMAPEQAQAGAIDYRADLFSLGSVLYTACSGRPPFRASTTLAVLKRVVDDTPRPIREIIPEVPEWLAAIIARLHAKDPAERFQSAREVAELLGRELAVMERGGERPRTPPPAPPAKRSRRVLITAALAVTLAMLGVGGYLLAPTALHIVARPPPGDLFQGAALHMTFAKDTFYEKGGKTYVRDMSGNGNDGLCDGVAYAPEGKAGGGLEFDGKGCVLIPHSLFNHQANYTVAAWVRMRENAPDAELVKESNSENTGMIYDVSFVPGGGFFCGVYNQNTTENWINCDKAGAFPHEKWFFLSIALENGGAGTGSLRVTIDDKEYHFPSQMVDSPWENTCVGLGRRLEGTLGEVAVFQRFLSAGEIEAIRQRGGDRNTQSTQPASPAGDLFRDAALHMTFAKDAFYEKEGKTYVRDLSGRGNDGLCDNVAFTPDGKAGGGLLCQGGKLQLAKSLIKRQPNYTITAWCRCEKPGPADAHQHLYLTATPEKLNESCFDAYFPPERTCYVNAWNADLPEYWLGVNAGGSTVPAGWFFVAIALTDGETGKGKLRIVIDDRIHSRTSQMVAADDPPQPVDVVGYNMNGVIDELAVFQRALSDGEIEAIRQQGVGGDLRAKTPQPVGAMFQDAALHMTFAKDAFYEKGGKTYVRDLSGNGYDGLCEGAAYTPEGKAGGGLEFDGNGWLRIPHSLFNHQANYTVAAWMSLRENVSDGEFVREFTSPKDEMIYFAALRPGGAFGCGVFNGSAPGNWFNYEKAGVIPYGKRVFLTIALENGGAGTGSLRLTMDDKDYHFRSQMVDSSAEDTSVTVGKHLEGTLAEVAVFHRFLSGGEIEAIRQRGSDKAPPP